MRAEPPPVYVICPGRTYRRDTPDATHSAIFQQVEVLAVDEGITLGDLKGTLQHFARVMFGPDREIRLRPSYFPFTEPSVELDVSWDLGKGHRGWIEVLGAGMVDPAVFGFAREEYDPERWSGFAFGMASSASPCSRHGISDIRSLYENDLRFLDGFAADGLEGAAAVVAAGVRAGRGLGRGDRRAADRRGFEVDGIRRVGRPDRGRNHEHFRIGRVLDYGSTPNADRLRLAHVDVGEAVPPDRLRRVELRAGRLGRRGRAGAVLPGTTGR
jgi:tRNA-binding EMAP/Myf-like protein